MLTDIGRIERVTKFKHIGEIIKGNGLEKSAVEGRIHKMERGYGMTKDIYNKSENKALQYSLSLIHI